VKVLYLSHTGLMSGAERALLELLSGLPADTSRVVASPQGAFATAAREVGEEVVTVPAAEASLRLHPLHTPMGIGGIVRSALVVARLARRQGADLIHANSVRAGLVAALAGRVGAPPTVVYVHDCLPDSLPANMTRRAILSGEAVVLANSRYVARSFAGRDRSADVRTTYNGMIDERGELVSLGGRAAPSRAEARRRLGLDGSGPLLGLVAQITPWKGQETAIRALAAVRRELTDIRLLLVGEAKFVAKGTRFDNLAYGDHLRRLVDQLGLAESVDFLGERGDALEIMAALDVLVAPSWEEPFGRTIVEAMALGTPVVATEIGGPAEIIEDGVSGRLVAPREPELLATALVELLARPERRERIAREGRLACGQYTLAGHVESVVSAYGSLLRSR
jgi:glycosyltransferase involved in cell wall biosynthesis